MMGKGRILVMEKAMFKRNLRNVLTVCGVFATMLCAGFAQAQDVLCPEPANIATTAPADLAQVQSDIDRLTLCVERAKLLSELDKTIDDREKDNKNDLLDPLQPIMPQAAEVSRVMQQQNMGIAPVPMAQPFDGNAAEDNTQDADTGNEWKIRRIWGAKGNTKAQLVKGGGIVATVVKNDILPDGFVIVELSTIGVTIRKDGKAHELGWSIADAEEQK